MQLSCLLETKTTLVQLLPPMVTVGSAVIRGWLILTIPFRSKARFSQIFLNQKEPRNLRYPKEKEFLKKG